jgi:hypothetical protein
MKTPPRTKRQLAALPTVTGVTGGDGRWRFLTGDLPAVLRLLATLPVDRCRHRAAVAGRHLPALLPARASPRDA